MDVAFNQTEAHMNDPAMHDTTLRPDAWRDPTERDLATTPTSSTPADVTIVEPVDEPTQIHNATFLNTAMPLDSHLTAAGMQLAMPDSSSNAPMAALPAASQDATLPPPVPQPPSEEVVTPATTSQTAATTESAHALSDHPQTAPNQGAGHTLSLLDELQNSISLETPTNSAAPMANGNDITASQSPHLPQSVPMSSPESAHHIASGLGQSSNGLPPRPPPQEQPLIHPNYVHSQHIRDYHPHAANPAFHPTGRTNSVGNAADPNSASFVPPIPSITTASGPIGTDGASSPSSAKADASLGSNRANSASTAVPLSKREIKLAAGEPISPDDVPWTQEVQRKYEHFMEEERRYVNEARWDQFPQGSRLFVGKYN